MSYTLCMLRYLKELDIILNMIEDFKTHFANYCISSEGLEQLINRPKDPRYPERNIIWTDDFTV